MVEVDWVPLVEWKEVPVLEWDERALGWQNCGEIDAGSMTLGP